MGSDLEHSDSTRYQLLLRLEDGLAQRYLVASLCEGVVCPQVLPAHVRPLQLLPAGPGAALPAALGLELLWEVVGNSQYVLKRIRDNSGTSGEYSGDSIQNILGDLFSCGLGYITGTVFLVLDLWWLSLVWILISEVVCIWYMRDSLLMTVLTLLVHSEKLKTWQCCRIPKSNKQFFISRLWRFNQKAGCQC